MSRELSLHPYAISRLVETLKSPETTAARLHVTLRTLQRLGLSQADLRVHIERARAANDATIALESLEDNALLALDIVDGRAKAMSLDWGRASQAAMLLPGIFQQYSIDLSVRSAFQPSNLLPPRSAQPRDDEASLRVAEYMQEKLARFEIRPAAAELVRVPKSGMTSRPAALLAPEDRVILECFAAIASGRLDAALPPTTVWPRRIAQDSAFRQFRLIPKNWHSPYVIVADIESFFDTVDHEILAHISAGSLELGQDYADGLASFLDVVMSGRAGLPQGPLGSEVLASLHLLPLDLALTEAGWEYARFADDFAIAASSILDGRNKIRQLEVLLQQLGLRLNSAKTRVLSAETYEESTERPSKRVRELRTKIRDIAEQSLMHLDDSQDLENALSTLGVDEELMFGLFYHGHTTLTKVLDQIRDKLEPPLARAYARFVTDLSRRLERRDLPNDMLATEADLREALTFISSAAEPIDLKHLSVIVDWFPRLTEQAATYLQVQTEDNLPPVRDFLIRRLNLRDEGDWATAWYCYVAQMQAGLVTGDIESALRRLAIDPVSGVATRVGAVRALAAAGKLTLPEWQAALNVGSSAVRAELLLEQLANPLVYPAGPPESSAQNMLIEKYPWSGSVD